MRSLLALWLSCSTVHNVTPLAKTLDITLTPSNLGADNLLFGSHGVLQSPRRGASQPRPAVFKVDARRSCQGWPSPDLAAYSAPARPYLDSFEHDGTLSAVGMTIRGEPAFRARITIAPQPCIRWIHWDPDHDAAMRIGGEAPGRRALSQERLLRPGGNTGHRHLGSC